MDGETSRPQIAEQRTQLGLCPSTGKNASNYGDISRLLLSSLATSNNAVRCKRWLSCAFIQRREELSVGSTDGGCNGGKQRAEKAADAQMRIVCVFGAAVAQVGKQFIH